MIQQIKSSNVKLKINTVVSQSNYSEDMSGFINRIRPNRWKILQALPIDGQNSMYQGEFEITGELFDQFITRHKNVKLSTHIIPEKNENITDSYIMISPEGKFFGNTNGIYNYSDEIMLVGVKEALSQVKVLHNKFIERGGYYEW